MPVTYVICFEVVAERVGRFLSLLEGVLDAMREEPNFHQSILHRDPNAPHRFMLYETWEDHDDVLKVQLSRPYRQAWHNALPELLAAPRDFSIWQPLRADRGRRDASRSAPMRIWRRRTNTVVIRTQRVAFTVTQGNVPLAFPFDLSEEYRTANDGDLA